MVGKVGFYYKFEKTAECWFCANVQKTTYVPYKELVHVVEKVRSSISALTNRDICMSCFKIMLVNRKTLIW